MIKKTAFRYYLQSVPTLIKNFNWWNFPLVLFNKKALIKINSRNLKFYVSSLMDIWTLKEVLLDKQYQMFKKVPKAGYIIDIGAGIGDFSIQSAQKGCKVIAYECDSERISLLRENLKLNKITTVKVRAQRAKSLKKILKKINICSFLKMDCEGEEYQIFKNATRSDLDKVKYIAMEAHKFNNKMKIEFTNLIDKLKKNGFRLKIVQNPVHEYICYVFASK